jgi:hypothetical protein
MNAPEAPVEPGVDLLLSWVAALRAGDLSVMSALLCRDVVWQGLDRDLTCTGRDEVLDVLREQTPVRFEVTALELWNALDHAVLGTRSEHLPQPEGAVVGGQVYNVFQRRGNRFARIHDFTCRADAFAAAGLDESATWR